jgi:hypothetical protein
MALIPGTLPNDTCYGTPQDLLELFAQYLDVPALALNSKVFFSNDEPNASDAIWFDTNSALNPIFKIKIGGNWTDYVSNYIKYVSPNLTTKTVPGTGDYVIISDVSSSGVAKKTTAQAIANLAPATSLNNSVVIVDKKASGVAGGIATAGAWRTRDLTDIIWDPKSYCSLASNQFTLVTGTWEIFATTTAFQLDLHQVRLASGPFAAQPTSGGTLVLTGTSEYVDNSYANIVTRSVISGAFTIASSTVFQIQMQCSTGSGAATNGLGVPNTFGFNYYTIVHLRKVA